MNKLVSQKKCIKCQKSVVIPNRRFVCFECSTRVCFCGKSFLFRPFEIKTHKYCSNECRQVSYSFRNGTLQLICKQCNLTYITHKSHVKHRGSSFCSRKCQGLFKRLKPDTKREYKNNKYEALRHSFLWKEWRGLVFKRDGFVCQGISCVKTKENYLEPHHIRRFSKDKKNRFNVNNGVTLCRNCHNKTKKFDKIKEGHKHEIRTQLYTVPEGYFSI